MGPAGPAGVPTLSTLTSKTVACDRRVLSVGSSYSYYAETEFDGTAVEATGVHAVSNYSQGIPGWYLAGYSASIGPVAYRPGFVAALCGSENAGVITKADSVMFVFP